MNTQIIPTTLSKANQTAVPSKIRQVLGLVPGDKLLWRVDTSRRVIKVKTVPRQWGKYLSGLGKEIWGDVDVKEYIQGLRRDRV